MSGRESSTLPHILFFNFCLSIHKMFTLAVSITLFTILSGVVAMPFNQLVKTFPRDVAHIAIDDSGSYYLAFDRNGTLYGTYPVGVESNNLERRSATRCAQLTVDEAKSLPGWSTIEKQANDNWGSGYDIWTNPSAFPDRPAQACITTEVVQLTLGDWICNNHTTSTEGQLVGTNGQIQIQAQQGSDSSGSYTISSASTIGVSSTLTADIGIPEVVSITAGVTTSAEITDETSSSFDTSYNDITSNTVTIDASDGQTCTVETTTETCHNQASGNIRYLATGYVWFSYRSRRQGHFDWAINIESTITDEDGRSSFANFEGDTVASTSSVYSATCV
ncbi:hypothetical protein EDD85DRAFT_836990, partial [Armillaria nabsnona]